MKAILRLGFVLALGCGALLAAPNDSYDMEQKGEVDMSYNKHIYGTPQIEAIKNWGLGTQSAGVIEGSVIEGKGGSIEPLTMGEPIGGIRGWSGLGELFTMLQEKYFAIIFLCVLLFVPLAFFGHYKIIGARKYNHHNKLQVFSKYNIIVHWFAALPFVLICITGLMMIFGDKLGGGALGIRLLTRHAIERGKADNAFGRQGNAIPGQLPLQPLPGLPQLSPHTGSPGC